MSTENGTERISVVRTILLVYNGVIRFNFVFILSVCTFLYNYRPLSVFLANKRTCCMPTIVTATSRDNIPGLKIAQNCTWLRG